jgi:hypothetical protein
MEKTFAFAGVSTLNGTVAYRFANGADRVKVLAKNGHVDIDLRSLPEPMTKDSAIQFLNAQGIVAEATRVTAPKAQKAPKAKAEPVADEDGFVEPKDEKIQVAMTRAARQYPGLSAKQLYDMVMLTVKEFGDTEPSF